jgi:hypothetical protein
VSDSDLTPEANRAVRRIRDHLAQLDALPHGEEENRLISLALADAFNAGARLAFGDLAAAVIEQLRQKAPHIQLEPILTTGQPDLRSLLQQEIDERDADG